MTFRYATFTAEWWLWTNFDSRSQPKFRIDFHLLLNLGTAGLISELLVYSGSDFNTPCSNIRWAARAQSLLEITTSRDHCMVTLWLMIIRSTDWFKLGSDTLGASFVRGLLFSAGFRGVESTLLGPGWCIFTMLHWYIFTAVHNVAGHVLCLLILYIAWCTILPLCSMH